MQHPTSGEENHDIFVFKTNLADDHAVSRVANILNTTPGIRKWNVALDDEDKVLRVVCASVQEHAIIHLVQKAGFHCEVLPG